RQIRNRLTQPAVLELKVLQALHLLDLQPTELLAPPIIRHLAHADLTDCVHQCSGLVRPEHRPAATWRRSLQACIASLPLQSSLMSKTYLKSDHFSGGGSEAITSAPSISAHASPGHLDREEGQRARTPGRSNVHRSSANNSRGAPFGSPQVRDGTQTVKGFWDWSR